MTQTKCVIKLKKRPVPPGDRPSVNSSTPLAKALTQRIFNQGFRELHREPMGVIVLGIFLKLLHLIEKGQSEKQTFCGEVGRLLTWNPDSIQDIQVSAFAIEPIFWSFFFHSLGFLIPGTLAPLSILISKSLAKIGVRKIKIYPYISATYIMYR